MKKLLAGLFGLALSVLPAAAQFGPNAGAGDGVTYSGMTLTLGFNVQTAFFPITGGVSAWGQNAVTVQWQTNFPCASQINYGLTPIYGQTVTNATLVRQHTLTMTGLATGTDYHYNVVCLSGSTLLAQSGDQIVSTQGASTLASLIYPGGHVGIISEQNTANYPPQRLPADAIINTEFNATGQANGCNWAFTANSNGTVPEFAGCVGALSGRYPGLAYYFQVVLQTTGHDNPSGMVFNSGTWQSNISTYRVPQMVAQFGNFSSFYMINTTNEPWYTSPCYIGPGVYFNVGGCNFWTYPLQTLAPLTASTTLLGVNQFSFGETATRWGGDANRGFVNEPDLLYAQGGIERMQQGIISGVRVDAQGIESHVVVNQLYSENDLKYILWDLHRLGIVPVVTEANARIDVANSNLCPVCTLGTATLNNQIFGAQMLQYLFYDMIVYGGVTNFQFWPNQPALTGGIPLMGVYVNNQKTPFYSMFTNLLLNVSPATTFPRVRRLNFVLGPITPPAITSQVALLSSDGQLPGNSLFGYYYGTPGLITIPWNEYVYRTKSAPGVYGPVTTFSQTSWTVVAQYYVQTGSTATGTYFQMQDVSSNPLVSIARSSGGVNTVTIGRAAPITACTDGGTNTFNNITITKSAGTFYVSCNGGVPQSTTATIAAVATINWLDNSGSETIANDLVLSTLDVYEANSIITDTAALETASTFVGSNSITYAQFAAFNPTPPSGTAPVVTLLSPQPNIASPVSNGINVANVNAPFGSSGAVTYSATCGGVACTGTNAITSWAITAQSRANAYSITSAGVLQGGSAASGIGTETDTVTITATNSTGTSPGVVQTVNAAAYIVAAVAGSGSTCTLSLPCSVGAAQTKAQSAAFKTILARSGTYSLASASISTGIKFTSADNGEALTYYGPDGIGNAVFDFTGITLTSPSTSFPLGTNTQNAIAFWCSGCAVTVNGITVQNFPGMAFAANGGTAPQAWFPNVGAANFTIENNNILNGNGGGPPFSPVNCAGDYQNVNCLFSTQGPAVWASGDGVTGGDLTINISNNNIQNMMTTGISVVHTTGCPTVTGNYLQNLNIAGGDAGGIYTQFVSPASTCNGITNNYLRDYKSLVTTYTTYARNIWCIYHDENSTNLTDSGNVCLGGPPDNVYFNGGVPDQAWCVYLGGLNSSSNNLIFKNNVCDAGTTPHFLAFITSAGTGNGLENNIYIGNFTGNPHNGYYANGLYAQNYAASPAVSFTNTTNFYYNYGGGSVYTNAVTNSSPVVNDANPQSGSSPLFNTSNSNYQLQSNSPALASPTSFPQIVGGWGPPGFAIPSTGTQPSY